MTEVQGVRDADGTTLKTLTLGQVRDLVASGVARDGMIPKLEACRIALGARVPEVRILGPDAAGLARILAEGPGDDQGAARRSGRLGPARAAPPAPGTRVLSGASSRPGARP